MCIRDSFTANSFTSVSLDPPLVSICIGDFNEGIDIFKNSKYFAINILNENQMEISNIFATPSQNKFDNTKWFKSDLGAPIIENSLAWFECSNFEQIRSGDHIILIGNVKSFKKDSGYPLGYYNGSYIKFNNEILQNFGDFLRFLQNVEKFHFEMVCYNKDKQT